VLVKSHSLKFLEDYGIVRGKTVHLYENGDVTVKKCSPVSPVLRVNALWLNRNARVKCAVADTSAKKRLGLQGHTGLEGNQGMYFPYVKYSNVTFHQGSVPFSLDLLFMRDNMVVDVEEFTKVGSNDRWSCSACDGVLEVNGGWCAANEVCIGDKVAMFALTQRDLNELAAERKADSFLSMVADRL
jgi:uncharacterized membrane protein (UPF0127 family)